MEDAWENLKSRTLELDALAGTLGLLEWDQQTYLPKAAGGSRGAQSAALAKLHHERSTDPAIGGWLAALAQQDLNPVQQASVRVQGRQYRRSTLLPAHLVEAQAQARSDAFAAWMQARQADNFALFEGPLQRLIDLNLESAKYLSTPQTEHLYDTLLEAYDPGSTVGELRPMFERLRDGLRAFLKSIEGKEGPAEFQATLSTEGMRQLSDQLIQDLGFDLSRGRLDLAEHPFTCGLSRDDVRLTTHLHGDNLLATLGGTIHECGHGLYEQGMPAELAGTGLDHACGMGMHESQSRFWENFIGRSLPFCKYLLPKMKAIWPQLDLSAEQLYGAANRVQRSLIRIYADEATYNLHIIARFELEVGIVEGRLRAADLPAAWDAAYRDNLGVVAPSAKQGVLQDVHWASGLLGYFPSYTIGNLYAASFGACIQKDIPDLWQQVEAGNFAPILGWLRSKVHQQGSLKDAPVLFKDIVGDRDPVADLLAHLRHRQGALYGI